ncbi:MAG: hypothetical protein A3B95_01635 [Candidatus Doudnabacteria bacterium RIFCSPHIGHO2_02_FULL_43_13b]|nr:MAG: hypothetical protein A3B95_01635 [Candidatus Doudnabacteria bacterium RIFCSPHIGHO2_02_FULL_43_13b]
MKISKRLLNLIFALIAAIIMLVISLTKPNQAMAPENLQPSTTYNLQSTTLFFAGDIMLSRNVARKIYTANDFTLPFQKVADVIKKADIAFANLESPFNNQGDHSIEGSLVFNADPKSVEGLSTVGFDLLSTANNHSFDQGKTGIDFTTAWLASHGVLSIGSGNNCHDGIIIQKKQLKFGFLAYSYAAHNDGGEKPDPLVCDWNDSIQVLTDIEKLKPQVDWLIISAHMGTEYQREPDEKNKILAHAAIDAGADLFIGHHPHWIQSVEQYHGKWIFYSLGNFVFDQMWSQDTKEGLTLLVTYGSSNHPRGEDRASNRGSNPGQIPAFAGMGGIEIKKIELRPVIIEDYCCPRWADPDETAAILKKINLTSPILIDKN